MQKRYSNKKAEVIKERIKITFSCSNTEEFNQLKDKIKAIPGRSFNTHFKKSWGIPFTAENVELLMELGFTFKGDKGSKKEDTPVESAVKEKVPEPEYIPYTDHLSVKLPKKPLEILYEYQREAIKFIIHFKGRALIAMFPGAGKTFIALYYAKLFKRKRPILIVCPAPIKLQWERECKKVLGKDTKITILNSKTPYLPKLADVYVINWDLVKDWKEVLCQFRIALIISDEVHAIGGKSKRTKAFKEIVKSQDCEHIAMSGTPAHSKIKQLFNILNLLSPSEFSNEWRFLNRYCEPKITPWGKTFNGATNLPELREKLKTIMFRKEKSEVFKDLPKKKRITVPMEISSENEYLALENSLYDSITDSSKEFDVKSNMMKLQRSAFPLKEKSVRAWIDNFVSDGNKLIVFAWHRSVIEYLEEQFKGKCAKVYGSQNAELKEAEIRKFAGDGCDLLLMNISTCTGIDGLQKICNDATFVEFPYTVTALEQAENRIDRLGQESPVNIYYLAAANTIDERYADILEKHNNINNTVIKGGKGEELNMREVLRR